MGNHSQTIKKENKPFNPETIITEEIKTIQFPNITNIYVLHKGYLLLVQNSTSLYVIDPNKKGNHFTPFKTKSKNNNTIFQLDNHLIVCKYSNKDIVLLSLKKTSLKIKHRMTNNVPIRNLYKLSNNRIASMNSKQFTIWNCTNYLQLFQYQAKKKKDGVLISLYQPEGKELLFIINKYKISVLNLVTFQIQTEIIFFEKREIFQDDDLDFLDDLNVLDHVGSAMIEEEEEEEDEDNNNRTEIIGEIDNNRLIYRDGYYIGILDARTLIFDKFDFSLLKAYALNSGIDYEIKTTIESILPITKDYLLIQISDINPEVEKDPGRNYMRIVDLKNKTLIKSKKNDFTLFGSRFHVMKRFNEDTIITADNEAIRFWKY